jgi:peptidyl-dipeptidase A
MKKHLFSLCKEIGKFIVYSICYIVYPFSFLFARNKKKYAFGSFRGAFNDNAKYLFIYTNENRKDIDAAWLSLNRQTVEHVRSMRMKAYCTYSPKGIWHALTSRYWF